MKTREDIILRSCTVTRSTGSILGIESEGAGVRCTEEVTRFREEEKEDEQEDG